MFKKRLMLPLILLFTAILITACSGGNNNENDVGQGQAENQNTAAGDPDAGREVYKGNCLPCHGTEGAGGHNGPSLQDSKVAKDVDAVIKQVTNGGGNMPAFDDKLSEEEIQDVAAYITEVVSPKGD